jgi:hypothetical protein
LIVCAIEAVRRTARDYDRMLATQRKIKVNNSTLVNPQVVSSYKIRDEANLRELDGSFVLPKKNSLSEGCFTALSSVQPTSSCSSP